MGLRVVELAGLGPAQHGCMLLADLGADVVRVDRPADVPTAPSERPPTRLISRGRRSIAVDLKSPAGREVFRALVERADVLVDPFRPGIVERLGIGPDECCGWNPLLIYARMTGWGQDGPLAAAAGHDLNYVAHAGALHPMGEPDAPPPVPLNLVGDFGGGGMLLAFSVMAAAYERERSGRGQVLDVAMVDGIASLLIAVCQYRAGGEWEDGRGVNWLQGAAPWYRAYATSDGRYVTVASLEPQFYSQLLERLGLDAREWPQWDRGRWPELRSRLEAVFASRTFAEWRAALEQTDVCFGAALDLPEVLTDPHLAARGTFVEYEGALQPAPVPRFSRTPGAIACPPAWPGADTDEVLRSLDVPDERRRALLAAGAVAAAAP